MEDNLIEDSFYSYHNTKGSQRSNWTTSSI